MSTVPLRIGDVVALKSGSRRMTVEGFFNTRDEHGLPVRHCNCAWFEGDRLYRAAFPVDSVRLSLSPSKES